MIEVTFNTDDFIRAAHAVGGFTDQVPFALANTLNQSVFAARQVLVQSTWPRHVTVRNPGFITQALRVERANKHNLKVRITTEGAPAGQRGHLALHAKGGTKQARGRLAIPNKQWVSRGSRGVRTSQLPKTIVAKTPKRALRITPRGIFVGEGGKLRLRYSLKPSAFIRPDVPFEQDFAYTMREEMRRNFVDQMTRAMQTAKPRTNK